MYSYSISVFAIFKKYLEKDKTVPFSLLQLQISGSVVINTCIQISSFFILVSLFQSMFPL